MEYPALKNRYLNMVLFLGSAALLVLSVLYYKERTIFEDAAYYIEEMTHNHGYTVAHSRFVGLLNQLLPAIFINLHLPLKSVVMAYSVGYALVPCVCIFLAVKWLKNPYVGLSILFFFTLMNARLFYFTVSEFQMGMVVFLLYDGVYDYYKEGSNHQRAFCLAALIMVPVIAFSHPLILPVTLAWMLYRWLLRRDHLRTLAFPAAIFFGCFLLKKFFFTSPYEAGKITAVELFQQISTRYYSGPIANGFYDYLISEAFCLPLVFLLLLIMLVRFSDYRSVIFLILTSVGFFSLIIMSFDDFKYQIYNHYYEHTLQPIVFFIVLILRVYLPKIRINKAIIPSAALVILIISFCKIANGSRPIAQRHKWMAANMQLMDSLKTKKAVLYRKWIPDGIPLSSLWNASMESLLLSSLDGKEHSKTLFLAWNEKSYTIKDDGATIQVDGWQIPEAALTKRYFELGAGKYIFLDSVINKDQLNRIKYQ